jgi:predicted ATPase
LQTIQSEGLVSILKAIVKSESTASKRGKFDADVAFNRVRAFLSRQGAAGMIEAKDHFERRYNEDEQLRRVVDNINSIEQKVENTRAARNSLQRLITDMFIGTKKVLFEDTRIRVLNDRGEDMQLALLSSGEKQAMLIFIDTLLAADSSLFIDEPEISLHVDWQRRLVSDMRLLNSNAQFILATHSPEIMAEIPDEKIFRL